MKFCNLSILTIMFFSINFGIAGDYVDLYKDFIPESMQNNPSYRADIERNLKTYLEIDPALVYYYIETLNMKADSVPPPPESNWRQLLQKHFGKSKHLKQEWAKVEKYQVEQKYEPPIKCSEISDYYAEFDYRFSKKMISIKSDLADNNKKNFYIYLYFSKSSNVLYDPEKQYSEMLKLIVKQTVEAFNSEYENKNNLTKIALKELINTGFQYPYLFKNGYLDEFQYTTDFHIYELIAYYLENDYINQHAVSIQVSDNFIPVTHEETFSFTDPFDIKYKYNYEIEAGNTIYLNIGFRFKIKELYYPFSFINMNLGFAIQKPLNNTFKRHVFFDGYKAIPGLSYTGSYYTSDYRDMKSMFITAQISTPVYYLSRKMFFEAGINYTLHKISFKYDFNRDGIVSMPYGGDPSEFFKDEELTYDKNHNLIYPLIAFNYLPVKSINIRLEYLVPLQARLALGYYLNL